MPAVVPYFRPTPWADVCLSSGHGFEFRGFDSGSGTRDGRPSRNPASYSMCCSNIEGGETLFFALRLWIAADVGV